jgi:DNA-directed RNA polymerase specialized sigma24 family protein
MDAPRLWEDMSPERILGRRQLFEHVQAAIERLPASQRAVLIFATWKAAPRGRLHAARYHH